MNKKDEGHHGGQNAGFSPTRRDLLKAAGGAGAAAVAAPLLGVGSALAAPDNGQGPGSGPDGGGTFGFPRPSSANQIWSVDYAGNLWPGLRNGPALFAMFFPATGIHVEEDGALKVADARNSVIRNISNLGDVTIFSGSVQQYPFKDGAASVATYNSPNDIARLSNGDYVVGDRENNAIRQVMPDGSVRTIAGQGNCKNRYNGDQADARDARLNRPLTLDIAEQSTGWHVRDTVYFADRDNFLIRRLVPNGDGTWALETVAGVPPTPGADPCGPLTYYPGADNGPASQATFRGPCGLVLSDDERYLYVAERDNNVVRVIDLMMGIVGTYAGVVMIGQGKGGYQDGPADSAKFNGPSQIDIDGGRNLFLADRFNHIIRKIKPSADPMKGSLVQTYAGTPLESGRRSGPADEAQFYEPWGLAIDRNNGLIFIGDTGNSRVAVIGPFQEIWSDFVQRINVARIAEYQALMAEYTDYYRGSPERSRRRPPYTGEGRPTEDDGL
ncbi:MAG: twin-arginine translocation signal domain-containing protein [Thiobacillus sp.]